MNKFLRIIPTIVLSVFLMSSLCFVFADETPVVTETEQVQDTTPPEQTQPDKKTVTGIRLTIDAKNRFVKLGSQPDFTGAKINVTYYDGSTAQLDFDKKYLVEWKGDTLGRRCAKFDVDGNTFNEYFVVYDEAKDALAFEDVYKTYWGYRQIQHCFSAGFFVGVSKTTFGIADNMTRAQFCQMIYQIYKDDESVMTQHKQASFVDVESGAWYFEAVTTCAESGIVNGMGDDTFCPDSPIKREDVAVIMMRILLGAEGAEGVDVDSTLKNAREKLGVAATDFDTTSEYAKKYVASALGVIYYGDEKGNINPKNNITRAECASMINSLFFDGFVDPVPKRLVYLSPSNQNSNQYSIYNRNDSSTHVYTEGLQMQKIGNKVAELLKGMGYEVHIANFNLSIRGDENSRPVEAGKMGADAYVAIHSNGISGKNNGKYQGTICYYNGNNKGAKELSDFIYNRMSALTPTKDGGSRNDMTEQKPFTEVKNPTMANVLIEVEYHDYATYATWIVTHTDEIANAIALGIDEYLRTL